MDSPALHLADDVVGGWLQLPGSAAAELVGSVGFGFVVVDQQHGLIGDDALVPILQALDVTGTPALVRVTHNEPSAIGRALDRGAAGVVVPLVDTAEQAALAAAACHYPPRGCRSYGPSRVAWHRRRTEPLCVVMVETLAGLAALPEITAVGDLDAVFVGPSDLALTTGRPLEAQDGDPEYEEVLRGVAEQCRERDLPVGVYCASSAHVRRFRELGFTFFAGPSEGAMLRAAAAAHLQNARAIP
ncbi:HpcH/HpaI aldolase family protein [Pseudonocardia nigra]|uniref:HpcH/HpaI aldolase family protein n=1 Tax=Pseudonocardia nigra TaxID=1921578 RepID=UPI001C5F7AE8|nr:aldolase/citrate lyase family protein [Pseudonocardia nigra]